MRNVRYKKLFGQSLLALSVVGVLSACNSSGGSDNGSTPLPDASYACQANVMEQSNQLRTYQIMVESFVDGDSNIGHGTGYGTSHHNGDLQGIIDSLDYIQDLGMNAIWLTPVFESEAIDGQDHWADRLDATGYFATDYFKIDPRFGDLETARTLVDEAHKRGLYVFFDGVFGHHKEGLIKPSPSGLLPSGSSNPVDYPASLDFYKEVATYWVKELKIDGWRLDQAYQVPTDAWTQIRKAVDEASQSVTYTNAEGDQVNPLGYMVAEIWKGESEIASDAYGAADDPALCSAFDFPMRYRVVETLAVNESGVGGRGVDWLDNGYQTHNQYPSHAQPNLMIGNHDLVRFGDLLQRGGLADVNDAEYWQRHKAVFAFQAAYTGPITLYYGDEIGDQVDGFDAKEDNNTCAVRGVCDDHVARSSAKIEGVTATLDANQVDLKNYVKSLMTMRAAHPALYQGSRTNLVASNGSYVDLKVSGDDQVLFALNTFESARNIVLTEAQVGSNQALVDLITNQQITPSNGQYQIPMSSLQGRFFKVTPNTQ
ncbi:glycosidase [Vibrio campbellii]|uniref:alpha-amylase family glycosyl hydrolase n=1 Tax=Vibrio campbellii TaxID=680 RepID=UPI000A2FFE5E|nr:alpha-amylase family glycosyl hydrolase [Vibrio campbellii]ARR09871.1 glycosidase [Vibrio campbellii]ARR47247.1 glycosidase [Vibrio campbellii]HDM8215673.1 glycosidase [Vibrio campbellii]